MNLIVYLLEHLIWNFAQQACDLFVLANLTPQKKNGRNMFCEVFSQGIEELRLKISKNGESHKLGDVMNTPHWSYTLLVSTRLLSVFLSKAFIVET